MVWPIKWNLSSSTFTWYYLLVYSSNSKFSDEILWCYFLNETSPAILSNGTICLHTVLTLNYPDEILWCDPSNETYLAVPWNCTIWFSIFYGCNIEFFWVLSGTVLSIQDYLSCYSHGQGYDSYLLLEFLDEICKYAIKHTKLKHTIPALG